MKKTLKILGEALSWIVILVLIAAIAGVAIPQAMGMKIYSVLTGSMLPTYGVSDLLYIAPTKFEDIKVDDCITYPINSQGIVITHRVIKIDEQKKAFYTKGDNNKTADGLPVSYKNVIGVVKFSVPKLGRIIQPIITTHGKVAVICAILICVILMNLAAYLRNNPEPKEHETENGSDYEMEYKKQ